MFKFFQQLGNVSTGTKIVGGGIAATSAGGNHIAHCRRSESFESEKSYILVEGESAAKIGDPEGEIIEASKSRTTLSDNHRAENSITSAIEFVSSRRKIKDSFLPAVTSSVERDRAWEQILVGVRDVLSQPDVMDKMIASVRNMNADRLQSDLNSLVSDSDTVFSDIDIDVDTDSLRDGSSVTKCSTNNLFSSKLLDSFHTSGLQWDELVADNQCMICKDLLAAPVITGCSHSFCGICLTDHLNSILSADVEVVHPCPMCEKHIVYDTYETNLDEAIKKDVKRIPDCKAKEQWTKRRNEYLLKKNNNKMFNDELDFAIRYAIPVVAMLVIVCMICL